MMTDMNNDDDDDMEPTSINNNNNNNNGHHHQSGQAKGDDNNDNNNNDGMDGIKWDEAYITMALCIGALFIQVVGAVGLYRLRFITRGACMYARSLYATNRGWVGLLLCFDCLR